MLIQSAREVHYKIQMVFWANQSEEAPAELNRADGKNPGRLHCLRPACIEILLEGKVSCINN